LRRRGRCR